MTEGITNPVRALKPIGKPTTTEDKKLFKTCREFESVMLGQVLKQMHASVQTSDPLNQGSANRTYREMLDDEIARSLSHAGGIGLAESMYRQLHGV